MGVHASNRAHRLRAEFDARGARILDPTRPGSLLLALRLESLGREGRLAPVGAGVVSSRAARIEIRRPDVLEWFDNSPRGLEHGFELAERPSGEGALVFALALDGAQIRSDGPGLVLEAPGGRKLRYSALHVEDARGRVLPARFELHGERALRIAIDDATAVYPVLVDPLLTAEPDATLYADPAFPQFQARAGESVANAGDVNGDGYSDVIVGAPFYSNGQTYEGAALIFYGGPGGFASLYTLLESNQADAQFGASVAGAGDVNGDGYGDVIVGAPRYDAPQDDEGAAFVFLGSANRIVGTVPDGFGREVGGPAIADARLESNQIAALLGNGPSAVAGAGDVNGDGYADVIVGAESWESSFPSEADEGGAWIFLGSSSGIADGNPATAAASLQSNRQFGNLGHSVAGVGDLDSDGYADIAVGAPGVVNGLDLLHGSVCVQYGGPGGIASAALASCQTRLDSEASYARLGADVAAAGDINADGFADLVVGSPGYYEFTPGEGAAWIYLGRATRIPSGQLGAAAIKIHGLSGGANLGSSVAGGLDVNGDGYADLLVGADGYNSWGAAYVFTGGYLSGTLDETQAYSTLVPVLADFDAAQFGYDVALVPDANGDGLADALVGAPAQDYAPFGAGDRGRATVYWGQGPGIRSDPPQTQRFPARAFSSFNSARREGWDVAPAGDVNSDGGPDIAVVAYGFEAGEAAEGAAAVLGVGLSSLFQTDQNAANVDAARAAGDVNGDGYGDLIIGSAHYDAGHQDEGAVWILHGGPTGIASGGPSSAATRLEGGQTDMHFGVDVASGDVNGDGYSDVLVAADGFSNGQSNEGAVFLFLGRPGGIASQAAATAAARFETDQADAYLHALAAGGDVNRDGYADVIVGAESYADAGQAGEGSAFVLLGGPTGLASGGPGVANRRIQSNQAGARLGAAVAFAGDLNGDGFEDVAVGAPGWVSNAIASGGAFVFHGSAAGIAGSNPANASRSLAPGTAPAAFGFSVEAAGDIDADGFADLLVGAPFYPTNAVDLSGALFVYRGSSSGILGDENGGGAQRVGRGIQFGENFGWSAAGVGDFIGFGYSDVVAGAPDVDAQGSTAAGEATLFSSGQLFVFPVPRVVELVQLLDSVDQPVPPAGPIRASAFRVRMRAYDPAGRGRVKLEIEACAADRSFGDPGCLHSVSASWIDVGATGEGVVLTQAVSGLVQGTAYRWRARTLRAPFSATQPGISAAPDHGPWRRLHALSRPWDLRVLRDRDGDGIADAFDNCPYHATPDLTDSDADGRGNVCECGDQNGDGRNTVSDLVAINLAIFNPGLVTPLCDANNDGQCNVSDIVAVNVEIFSPTSTSTCVRQPVPGP